MGAQNQVKRHISKKENFFSCQCEFGKEGTKRNFYPKSSVDILGWVKSSNCEKITMM